MNCTGWKIHNHCIYNQDSYHMTRPFWYLMKLASSLGKHLPHDLSIRRAALVTTPTVYLVRAVPKHGARHIGQSQPPDLLQDVLVLGNTHEAGPGASKGGRADQ